MAMKTNKVLTQMSVNLLCNPIDRERRSIIIETIYVFQENRLIIKLITIANELMGYKLFNDMIISNIKCRIYFLSIRRQLDDFWLYLIQTNRNFKYKT